MATRKQKKSDETKLSQEFLLEDDLNEDLSEKKNFLEFHRQSLN